MFSGDGTTHWNVNYESRHIATLAPVFISLFHEPTRAQAKDSLCQCSCFCKPHSQGQSPGMDGEDNFIDTYNDCPGLVCVTTVLSLNFSFSKKDQACPTLRHVTWSCAPVKAVHHEAWAWPVPFEFRFGLCDHSIVFHDVPSGSIFPRSSLYFPTLKQYIMR